MIRREDVESFIANIHAKHYGVDVSDRVSIVFIKARRGVGLVECIYSVGAEHYLYAIDGGVSYLSSQDTVIDWIEK